VRPTVKAIRSVARLIGIVAAAALKAARALLCGDREAAAMHVRVLTLALLDDASQALVRAQRTFFGPLRPDEIDRILIVKLDRIGDMVTTTPVFDALRAKFPSARLDIVAHPAPLSLLADDERIGQRIAYRSWLYHPLAILPPGPRTWGLVLRLMWRRYPLVVCLRGSFSFLPLGLVSRMTATKFIEGEPVIRRYLRSIEELLGPLSDPPPRLRVSAENRRFAAELFAGGEADGPRVAIHATASSQAKMWPAERFSALADALRDEHGAAVHFLGAPSDRGALDAIARHARHEHAYHMSLSLPQVAAVIEAADAFIGNDSGLAHIAAAVGTRMAVIWGAPNLSMARPRADEQTCTILYHDLPCRQGCPEFRCNNPNRLECLLRTEVLDVFGAVSELLARGAEATEKEACSRPT